MALTKVRPPVTDISIIDNGTTQVNIATAGGDIDVDVAGVNVMDISSTTVVVAPAVTLDASLFTGEAITLATTSGAALTFETQATLARLLTTSAHPLELGANNITALTVDTAGKVELDVEGTAVNHLITKAYVDALTASVQSESDTLTTQASTGHVSIPTETGDNLIFNWGKNAVVANGTYTNVTFDLAFPNAIFVGFANATSDANHDGTLAVNSQSLSTMQVHSSLDKASAFDWFAIGY